MFIRKVAICMSVVVIEAIVLWAGIISTDYVRAKMQYTPLFTLERQRTTEMTAYICLGYTVIHSNQYPGSSEYTNFEFAIPIERSNAQSFLRNLWQIPLYLFIFIIIPTLASFLLYKYKVKLLLFCPLITFTLIFVLMCIFWGLPDFELLEFETLEGILFTFIWFAAISLSFYLYGKAKRKANLLKRGN